jgi:hypothetical protein
MHVLRVHVWAHVQVQAPSSAPLVCRSGGEGIAPVQAHPHHV